MKKENDTTVTTEFGSIPPNKNDLTKFYVGVKDVSNVVFMYLAWYRAAEAGAVNLSFEFNQASFILPSNCGVGGKVNTALNHTAGDMLILYSFGGSGAPQLQLSRWLGTASSGNCEAGNKPCWGAFLTLNGNVSEGAVSSNKLFGEAVLNLTGIGIVSQTQCIGFAQAYLKSRSSPSIQATLKDYVAPGPANFDFCGRIKATKYNDLNANGAQDTGEPGLGGWTIFLDANGNGVLDSGERSATTASAPSTVDGTAIAVGDALFTGLFPGTYTVCEVLQTTWLRSDPGLTTSNFPNKSATPCKTMSVTTGASLQVQLGNFLPASVSGRMFNDPNANGTQDSGDVGQSGWQIHLVGLTAGADCDLSTGAVESDCHKTTDGAGNYAFTGVQPGTYWVCETMQPGWQQTLPTGSGTGVIDCSHDGPTAKGYVITLQSGDALIRNFAGRRLFRLIVVTCNDLTNALVGSTVVLGGESKQTITVPPGSFTQQALCDETATGLANGGASYPGATSLTEGTYTPTITIPSP